MTIAERRTEQAGSPARPKRRWGLHAATVIVLVIGLGITIVLSVVTARGHQRTNFKLLALQTRLIGNLLATSGPLYVEDHLGTAARVAAATNGDVATFRNDMGTSVTAKGPFAAASLCGWAAVRRNWSPR